MESPKEAIYRSAYGGKTRMATPLALDQFMGEPVEKMPPVLTAAIQATCSEVEAAIVPKPHVKHPTIRRGLKFPNHSPKYAAGSYQMHTTHTGLREAVARCMKALRRIADQFDAIFVTGQSGIVPGSIVAYQLKKELIILRKDKENAHGAMVEGKAYGTPGIRYVIIDDFVSGGSTLARLLQMRPYLPNATLVAICLYGHPRTNKELRAGCIKEMELSATVFNPAAKVCDKELVHVVRRGPTSILFDLKRNVKQLGDAAPARME